jgi:hypothetical protein
MEAAAPCLESREVAGVFVFEDGRILLCFNQLCEVRLPGGRSIAGIAAVTDAGGLI